MPSDDSVQTDEMSLKERLVRAADEEIRRQGTVSVSMATIAERAGVSRATAFRQLGGAQEMIVQVGLLRAERHIERALERSAGQGDIFSKMEDTMAYNARELPEDPVIVALMAQHSASARHPDILAVTSAVSEPLLRAGQDAGIIRTDVPLEDLLEFLIEQTFLAAEDPDRSDAAARLRFRRFVVPALRPQPAEGSPDAAQAELEQALATAADALATATRAARKLQQGSPGRVGS
ncbi:TetR/AcrR family transcriptional regulator [Rhodococcus sp. Z13]|uniref:TetR/AcrR family transcriptional regulator n=1 Tax=Rhodococcus sacchari TaxID=2962047 RepID=A0ACD4DG80_9NOCA|nr:TetR/AcrR family transcriptional regulator [Rhodococcus sp. Z13]UYP19070.1 TetR/AcrR family transcriptional regulator [Rhodococcus sp. Z13]